MESTAIKSAYLPITDDEKRQIQQAISIEKLRWYKCPQGHLYVVADCGNPAVSSTCIECGCQIGSAPGRNDGLAFNNVAVSGLF